ncbi:ABC transporter substrate-binding protein [Paenibacillus beijingensis]|uniref:ABC transporter substrate-binding protein n=2 Tax=Paenibacillus beijingensis TaxID=1126833 RepID=A0A0D5NSN3_9BACL|nr:zinc ABC transporter substrate-binding protein [Paenibacillus beijingensis]AJY78022.1 ABC transporter substrate-binding protein [Paenibacillus beijingensis]
MVAVVSACGGQKSGLVEGKTNVVTSFYPIYFLAKEIGGDKANVVNLVPAGVEPHDWTPKSRDLQTAGDAELFLYNGAGLEGWVADFVQGLPKDGKTVTGEVSKGIKLLTAEEEEAAALEVGEGEAHGEEAHNHEEEHHDEHGEGIDPHTWVSPKSALVMAGNVRDYLVSVDAANKSVYDANYEKLAAKLTEIDQSYIEELGKMPNKAIVVSHQAFGYLCRDYGLKQVAIMGLSPDAEPRAQDLLNIAKFVKDNGVKTIFFEELVSAELADTLAREANVGTLVLNPLEGLTPEQDKDGTDYISLMETNLKHLKQALQ